MTVALPLLVATSLIMAAPTQPAPPRFTAVVLGAQGGLLDGDLTSVLVARAGATTYLALDAGTVAPGVAAALRRGALAVDGAGGDSAVGVVVRRRIRAYAITHPHLDHAAGLAIVSADDVKGKRIYGLPSTIDALRDHVFNHVVWPNLANEGASPRIGLYTYARMKPGEAVPVEGVGVTLSALPLAHAGATSTAFLVEDGDAALLYVGDTGPDAVERTDKLARMFERIAPLVRARRLRAIFIEASWPSARDDALLFGHLTPRWLLAELRGLAVQVDPAHPERALAGLPVVVLHRKPSLDAVDPRPVVERELLADTRLGVRFLFPQQGDRLDL